MIKNNWMSNQINIVVTIVVIIDILDVGINTLSHCILIYINTDLIVRVFITNSPSNIFVLREKK